MVAKILNNFLAGDSSKKYVWDCGGNVTETAVLKLEYREPNDALCVPSQFGCRVRCDFCASRDVPYTGNLNQEQLLDLIEQSKDLGGVGDEFQVSFMGQGEPLFNIKNISQVSAVLRNRYPKISFGMSTIGIPVLLEKILENYDAILQETKFQLSLHSLSENKRQNLIPYSARYSLDHLINVFSEIAEQTQKKVCMNTVLFKGINDSKSDLNLFKNLNPALFYIKLSVYNDGGSDYLQSASEERFTYFKNNLLNMGFEVKYFKSRGVGVNAGCGQLCRNYYKKLKFN